VTCYVAPKRTRLWTSSSWRQTQRQVPSHALCQKRLRERSILPRPLSWKMAWPMQPTLRMASRKQRPWQLMSYSPHGRSWPWTSCLLREIRCWLNVTGLERTPSCGSGLERADGKARKSRPLPFACEGDMGTRVHGTKMEALTLSPMPVAESARRCLRRAVSANADCLSHSSDETYLLLKRSLE
jgi:hypothetical protein